MAQSAVTVTPPNPTPPTNYSFTGATAPNPPNYTKNTMNDPKNWSSVNPKDFPPPYYDDGTAGPLTAFAANIAALASGSGATAGGTENTYPGAAGGVVPASTSVAHEGAGSEVVVTNPGNIDYTYPGAVTYSSSKSVSDMGSYTTTPNASHASYLSAATLPTITSLSAGGASGSGTTLLTVTGTGFNRASVVTVGGVKQTTNYVSPTSLTVTNAPKSPTAGNVPVTVYNGTGGTPSAPTNWVFT